MPQDPECLVVPALQWALQLAHITAGRQEAAGSEKGHQHPRKTSAGK